jgi:hypothetical protein
VTPHAGIVGEWTSEETAREKYCEWVGRWARPGVTVTWALRDASSCSLATDSADTQYAGRRTVAASPDRQREREPVPGRRGIR